MRDSLRTRGAPIISGSCHTACRYKNKGGAAQSSGAGSPVHPSLQPGAPQPAALCTPACSPVHPACNPVHPACNPVHPSLQPGTPLMACNPMYPACSPTYPACRSVPLSERRGWREPGGEGWYAPGEERDERDERGGGAACARIRASNAASASASACTSACACGLGAVGPSGGLRVGSGPKSGRVALGGTAGGMGNRCRRDSRHLRGCIRAACRTAPPPWRGSTAALRGPSGRTLLRIPRGPPGGNASTRAPRATGGQASLAAAWTACLTTH